MKKTIRDRKEKGARRRIFYIPLRYIFAFLITVAATLLVIGAVVALTVHLPYFYLLALATQIVCIVTIAASDDNPDYKVPWLLVVLILPVAGFMLYFMFYSRKLKRKYINRLAALRERSYKRDDEVAFRALEAESTTAANQAKLLCSIADTHLFTGTDTSYLASGEAMHESLLQDLQQANAFIFMEYFIIEEGVFWNSILEILKEKAAAGVLVAVLYDDIGCMRTLPGNYAKRLKRYGIHAAPFSRVRGNADSEFNNRSHRKITVIDGHVGYTGGVNIADEYINRRPRFGHWKDSCLRLEGEAVFELTKLFLVDFGITMPFPLPPRFDCFPPVEKCARGFVVPFGDGPRPIYPRRVAKSAIQALIASAKRSVTVTTPYLIIDNELCSTLEQAALRGVAVKIILPHIPDKRLIFSMSRSYYPRLLSAGVEVYEYEPGFIHAKSYLADDTTAIIGTVNLDYRSLVHHFENGVWMYRTDAVAALKEDMQKTLAVSIPIRKEMLRIGPLRKFLRSMVRVFAPLL
ncbi:MAG: cardiolipin synthase [Ruminococcaceae bacterium]|nr:cardiolipin synthase [Oscillospiraceae bacterium]